MRTRYYTKLALCSCLLSVGALTGLGPPTPPPPIPDGLGPPTPLSDVVMAQQEPEGEAIDNSRPIRCLRDALSPRYYGSIYFEGDVPHGEDPWSFQPGDPVQVTAYEGVATAAKALLRIDMKGYIEARVTVWYMTDPVGWVTNLGDSSTNNGRCGDSGTSSFDAELWVVQPPAPPHDPPWFEYDVGVCSNVNGDGIARELDGLLAAEGPTALTFIIRNQYLRISSNATPQSYVFTGPGMFRIDGIWDDEAYECNDAVLWLGLNRVVSSTGRSGHGVILAEVELLSLADWVAIDKIGVAPPLDSLYDPNMFDIP